MFVTSDIDAAGQINKMLSAKTKRPHHLFCKGAEVWIIDLADDAFWVLGIDRVSGADIALRYYNRPVDHHTSHVLESVLTSRMSLDALFDMLNAQVAPLGFAIYRRQHGKRIILHDFHGGEIYDLQLEYKEKRCSISILA